MLTYPPIEIGLQFSKAIASSGLVVPLGATFSTWVSGLNGLQPSASSESTFRKARMPSPYCAKARLKLGSSGHHQGISEDVGFPCQSLINLYLRDCAATHRKLNLDWK